MPLTPCIDWIIVKINVIYVYKNSTKSAQKTNIFFWRASFPLPPERNNREQRYVIEMIQYISKMLCVCIQLKSRFSWNTYCHQLHDHYGYQLQGGGIEVEVCRKIWTSQTMRILWPPTKETHLSFLLFIWLYLPPPKKNCLSLGVFFTSSIILIAAILTLSVRSDV